MPKAVRYADMCSGHDGFPPRPSVQGSGDVFINHRPAHRVADAWNTHSRGGSHAGVMAVGSPNVFVNGKPLARVGDLISCGSTAATGSPNVFVNEA